MMESILVGMTRFVVGGAAHWVGCAPSPQQRIYFANHSSHLDTLLIWAALPRAIRKTTHPVAAADYWGKPGWRGRLARKTLKAVLIERKGATAHEPSGTHHPTCGHVLEPVSDCLRSGGSLIFFPEGTRGSERLPGPFRSGLHQLALAFPAVELVPVYLENPGRAFPKGAKLPVPIACSVRFGAPIRLQAGEDKASFLARANAAVAELAP
jgi:1-acyl-sn-glycerol-3-phosphate acyltransferase